MAIDGISQGSLIALPSTQQWEQLYNFRLKFGSCWENCNSYCCCTNHPAQSKLALMKKNAAGMVFMAGEYNYLSSHHYLQTNVKENIHLHELIFDRERNLKLQFYTSVCDLKGMCSNPDYRPLICKMYPFYPYFDPELEAITKFTVGSVLDQYWNDFNIEHPCWLVTNKPDEVKDAILEVSDALNYPYFIFYFGVVNMFVTHISQNCRKTLQPKNYSSVANFFSEWEISYLMQKFYKSEQFTGDVKLFYNRIERKYGEFLI